MVLGCVDFASSEKQAPGKFTRLRAGRAWRLWPRTPHRAAYFERPCYYPLSVQHINTLFMKVMCCCVEVYDELHVCASGKFSHPPKRLPPPSHPPLFHPGGAARKGQGGGLERGQGLSRRRALSVQTSLVFGGVCLGCAGARRCSKTAKKAQRRLLWREPSSREPWGREPEGATPRRCSGPPLRSGARRRSRARRRRARTSRSPPA